jgi:RHS repeat-associated protein
MGTNYEITKRAKALFYNYYAFGSLMPGRNFSANTYRYGFNGKENDNEVKGTGNQQDYGMRIYDPRLGRFLSADPLIVQNQEYPELSPYQFASNTPIQAIDLDGLEAASPASTLLYIADGFRQYFQAAGKMIDKVSTTVTVKAANIISEVKTSVGVADAKITTSVNKTYTATATPNLEKFFSTPVNNKPADVPVKAKIETDVTTTATTEVTAKGRYVDVTITNETEMNITKGGDIKNTTEVNVGKGGNGAYTSTEVTSSTTTAGVQATISAETPKTSFSINVKFSAKVSEEKR